MTAPPSDLKLSYFDIEGVAEPIRLTLVLKGVDFEDHRFKFADWKDIKPKMTFNFAPEMTINGKSYPQSKAILMYCSKLKGKHDVEVYPHDDAIAGLHVDIAFEVRSFLL